MAYSNNEECVKKLNEIYQLSNFFSSWQVKRQILTFAVFHYLTHPKIYWLSKYLIAFLVKTKIAMFITDYLKITKPTAYPFPGRLANVQALIGLSQLSELERNLKKRKEIAIEFENITKANSKIFIDDNKCVWLRYPILVENREDFIRKVKLNYDLGIWFSTVTGCRDSNFHKVGYVIGSCPVAEKVTKQIISLPTHYRFQPREILNNALKQLKTTERGTYIFESARYESAE